MCLSAVASASLRGLRPRRAGPKISLTAPFDPAALDMPASAPDLLTSPGEPLQPRPAVGDDEASSAP